MNEPELGQLLRDGAFRWDDPSHRKALEDWEGTATLDPDDPRFRPVMHAVISYSKIDRAPAGARADRRALSRWAREIDRACRLPDEKAS